MSKHSDYITIQEILEVISNIESYLEGRTPEHLRSEKMLKDAILMSLIVIGELTKRLSEEIRNQYCDVDWLGIVGIRNRIAHGYFDVDLDLIWTVATTEIPLLKLSLTKIMERN
ncbi:MAG: DUF86 domain-containing protein [bacterium]|nr:DUF86 domain-containing protein [bacterium]